MRTVRDRMLLTSARLTSACALVLAACTNGERPCVATDDARSERSTGGESLVGPAADPAARWTLVEEWRVGGEARGPHSFDYNHGLALLPDGNLLHLDYQASELHVLDGEGKALRSFGRKGRGPGEIASANGFVVAPDGRIIINDQVGSQFMIFTPAGEFERSVRIHAPRGTGAAWEATMLRDGRLIETLELHRYERTGDDPRTMSHLWSADLSRVDTLDPGCSSSGMSLAIRNPDGSLATEMAVPFTAPETPFAYDPTGFRWEPRDPSSNEIVRRSLADSSVSAVARLAGGRPSIAGWQREIILARASAEAVRWKGVRPTIDDLPRDQAWYQAVHVDADGKLWVERALSSGSLAVDVFAPSGEPLGRISGDLPLHPAISRTHVYGLERDSVDISYLVARRIQR